MLPNEAVMSGPEKLKSMLGSTLAEVFTKELDAEKDWSPMCLAENEAAGSGIEVPCIV
jgi:hypothetical protein